jgi:hypothetical protein
MHVRISDGWAWEYQAHPGGQSIRPSGGTRNGGLYLPPFPSLEDETEYDGDLSAERATSFLAAE